MKFGYFMRKKLEDNLIEVILPEVIVSDFDSLFGLDNAKEILQDVVEYFNSNNPAVMPYTSYTIGGPQGTRKASLVFATAKASNVPVISLDTSIFSSKDESGIGDTFKLIFDVAENLKKDYKGCFIVFQNIHETEELENDNIFYLNLVKHFRNTQNIFLFALSSCEGGWIVPDFVLQEDLFSSNIFIEYPDLSTREKIFEDCIKKQNLVLAEDVSINRLAKDTYGETYHSIEHIVKDAKLYSIRKKHPKVTQNDFAETIMRLSAGDKNLKMTEKERKLTAYHEAGHVIAGYFSDPEYVLNRVEISPRSQGSLGLTISDIDESKYSYFKTDFENRIIMALGGLAAEEEVFETHTSGVISDLSTSTAIAANMVKAYGMDEEFGPMVILPNVTDSTYSRALAEIRIKEIIEKLLAKTKEIISEKRPYLDALTNALLEKEVVMGDEIKEIFNKVDTETKPTSFYDNPISFFDEDIDK